jgi:hypothetical protein
MFNTSRLETIAKRGYGSVAGGPFALDEWALATDGHVAVLVPAVAGETLPPTPVGIASAVRKWIALPFTAGRALSIASLRVFAKQPPCSKCNNTRRVTCDQCYGAGGNVQCECSKCGHEHEYTCDCDNGKMACPSCDHARVGVFLGKKIDTRLLHDVLGIVADERNIDAAIINLKPGTTQRGHAHEALVLKPHGGDPWIAFVMPMMDDVISVVTYNEAQATA